MIFTKDRFRLIKLHTTSTIFAIFSRQHCAHSAHVAAASNNKQFLNSACSTKTVSGNYSNKTVVDKITARCLPKEELQDDSYFCRRSGAHFFRSHASNGSAPDDNGHGAMVERQLAWEKPSR